MSENVSEISHDFQNLVVSGKSINIHESPQNSFQNSEELKSSPKVIKIKHSRKNSNCSELNQTTENKTLENGTGESILKTENDIIKQPNMCKNLIEKQCDKTENQKTRNSCTNCTQQVCTEKLNNNELEVDINSLGATAACITAELQEQIINNDQINNSHDDNRVYHKFESEEKQVLSSSTSESSNENLDQRGEQLRKLRSWINQRMTIEMTDGRVLVGMFLCTDRDANVILGSCAEYSPNASYSPLRSDDDCPYQEPRLLGLVMVPGHHIVRILHDPPQIT